METEDFGVQAEHIIGRGPEERGIDTVVANGVAVTVSNTVQNDALLTLHYRSVYDFKYRKCIMRLSRAGPDADKNFDEAKKFASAVTSLRGPLFSHPAVVPDEAPRRRYL